MESGVFQKSAFHSFLIWGEWNLYKKMSDKILISHTEKNTDLLGPYRRFVIWVHGCCFDCEGCLAENTKNGAYTETDIKELAQEILMSDTEGITISGREANHFTFHGFLAKVNYENPPTDEQIVAKCPAKCMSVDPHFESGK